MVYNVNKFGTLETLDIYKKYFKGKVQKVDKTHNTLNSMYSTFSVFCLVNLPNNWRNLTWCFQRYLPLVTIYHMLWCHKKALTVIRKWSLLALMTVDKQQNSVYSLAVTAQQNVLYK